jgi:hypothetical protein
MGRHVGQRLEEKIVGAVRDGFDGLIPVIGGHLPYVQLGIFRQRLAEKRHAVPARKLALD